MIFIKNYSKEELTIFEHVKKFFETLPPIGSDAYENAFYDLVAQYGPEGEEYLTAASLFTDVIEAQAEKAYHQLSDSEKDAIKILYESDFVDNDYHEDGIEEYIYDTEVLSIYISSRFKRWILDSFDSDYLK